MYAIFIVIIVALVVFGDCDTRYTSSLIFFQIHFFFVSCNILEVCVVVGLKKKNGRFLLFFYTLRLTYCVHCSVLRQVTYFETETRLMRSGIDLREGTTEIHGNRGTLRFFSLYFFFMVVESSHSKHFLSALPSISQTRVFI